TTGPGPEGGDSKKKKLRPHMPEKSGTGAALRMFPLLPKSCPKLAIAGIPTNVITKRTPRRIFISPSLDASRISPRPQHRAQQYSPPDLVNHLIGAQQNRFRHREAERLGGLHIDKKFDFCGLLDRQVGRLLAFENAPGIDAGYTVHVQIAAAVTSQAASRDEL